MDRIDFSTINAGSVFTSSGGAWLGPAGALARLERPVPQQTNWTKIN